MIIVKQKVGLSLLALVVVTSGCINGGSSTESQGSIHVNYLNFIPQDREIYTGGRLKVDMQIENIGQAPAALRVGEKGSKIFTNYCPYLFKLSEFRMTGEPHLNPGEKLNLNWGLQQQGDVLSVGSKCQMEFRLPFNYSASVYRQIQLKSSENVADANPGQLGYESSSGPLKFEVATIAPTGSKPILTMPKEGREKTAVVLMRLKNTRPERGSIDVHERTLRIKAPEIGINEGFKTVTNTKISKSCSTASLRLSQGMQQFCINREKAVRWVSFIGQEPKCNIDELEPLRLYKSKSRVIRCPVDLASDVTVEMKGAKSIISEIQASVNYTYTRELPSRSVKVKSRG